MEGGKHNKLCVNFYKLINEHQQTYVRLLRDKLDGEANVNLDHDCLGNAMTHT